MQKVIIYSDGSCLKNPGVGGWAYKIISKHGSTSLSGAVAETTNNQMELSGAILALERLKVPCEVELHTDSQYLCKGINEWLENWVKKSFKGVKNVELWQRLLVQLNRHKVTAFWVKAHAGHPENEECDTLARAAASRLEKELGLR